MYLDCREGRKDLRSTHGGSSQKIQGSSCISRTHQGTALFLHLATTASRSTARFDFLTQAFPAVAGRSASLSYVGRHHRAEFGFRPSATNSGQTRITHHQLRNLFLSAARALTIYLPPRRLSRASSSPTRESRHQVHTEWEHTAPRVTTIS